MGLGIPVLDMGMDLFKQDRAEQSQEDMQNFNAEQAAVSRNWQEYMRGSAYQATIEDMKKAGLNPMLAYSQGATSTPGTNAATSGIAATPPRTGTIAAGIQTAAQIDQIQAQTENIKADTKNKEAENPNIHGIKGIQDQTVALLREQAAQTEAFRHLNDEQRKLVNQQIKNAVLTGENIKADTRDTTANAVLRELDYNRARNEASAQFKYQDYFENVAPFTGELGKLVHSAKEARDAFRKTPAWRRR